MDEALELIGSFGETVVMPERLIDIAGQIGGASIAWLCLAMEGMADGAVAEGMPRDMAYKFAAAAMAGTGRLAPVYGQASGSAQGHGHLPCRHDHTGQSYTGGACRARSLHGCSHRVHRKIKKDVNVFMSENGYGKLYIVATPIGNLGT